MTGKAKQWFARYKAFLVAALAVLMILCSQAFTTTAHAAGDRTVLAFTSDAHNDSNNNSGKRTGTFIDSVVAEFGKLDAMGFCGDMGSASAGESDFWNYVQKVIDAVAEKNVTAVYTTGNHEFYNGNYATTTNAVKNNFKVDQIGLEGDNFVIYCLGTDNWNNTRDNYTTEQVSKLTSFLESASPDKPIFVISHFPLHSIGSRTTANADLVIDALNAGAARGLKITFLWGHNHTYANSSETNYDEIFAPESSITYTSSSKKTIDFYYCAAGCMSDSDYGAGSGAVKGKGLVVTIDSDDKLYFSYRSAAGVDVTEGGPLTEQDPVYATDLTLDQASVTVEQGRSVKVSATVSPIDATKKGVRWTSANESIATVSATGKIKGVGLGTTTITATTVDGTNISKSVAVNVVPRTSADPYYVITVTDGGTTYAMSSEASTDEYTGSSSYWYGSSSSYTGLKAVAYEEGDELDDTSLLWTVVEDDGGYVITSFEGDTLSATYESTSSSYWYSSATANLKVGDTEDVWSVDIDTWIDSGALPTDANAEKTIALEKGTNGSYLFTVRTSDNADTSYLVESAYSTEPVALQAISLDKTAATLALGRSTTLKASFTPRNATNKAVTWTSSDPTVASVVNGKVTANKVGTATITVASVEDPSIKATCAVTVTEAPATQYYVITITESGTTYALTNEKSPVSSSGNTGSSSSSYNYTGLKAVPYTSEDDIDESMLFSVEEADGGYYVLDIDGNYLYGTYSGTSSTGFGDVAVGDTADVWATTIDTWMAGTVAKSTNASSGSSSDKYLALENSGNDYFFTVRSQSNADTSKLVEVSYSTTPGAVASVTVSPASKSLYVGSTATLTATVRPSNAADKTVTWSSSDPAVATVSATGVVTAMAKGTATITATSKANPSIKGTCAITVKDPADVDTYVILAKDDGVTYALTTNKSNDTAQGGSSSYKYYGLSAVAYDEDNVTDDMLWTVEEVSGGYYIKSYEGELYLNGTYSSGSNSGTGTLVLDGTSDVWVIDGSFSAWEAGLKVKSTNASKGQSSDKFMSLEPGSNEHLFSMRSNSNADEIMLVLHSSAPAHTHTMTYTAAVAAGCETDGNSAYYFCSGCNKYFSDAAGTNEIAADSWIIPATGHDFGEPTYYWADDNSAVTAVRTCANNASHVQLVTAATTYAVVTPATETEDGQGVYIATFADAIFGTQTKYVVIPATGGGAQHEPGPYYDEATGAWYWYGDNDNILTDYMYEDAQTGKRYYFGKDGKLVTSGLITHDDKWYFVNSSDWAVATNQFVYCDGAWRYVGADGQFVVNDWVFYGNTVYYVGSGASPVRNAWEQYDGKWYYIGSDYQIVTNEWMQFEGEWYYFGSDGQIVYSTFVQYAGQWYFVDADGHPVVSDWAYYDGYWYFIGADGHPMTSAWVEYNGAWFYIDEYGHPLMDGWYTFDGYRWHFDANGICDAYELAA